MPQCLGKPILLILAALALAPVARIVWVKAYRWLFSRRDLRDAVRRELAIGLPDESEARFD